MIDNRSRTRIARIRKRTWEVLEAALDGDVASRVFDVSILTLIVLNVAAVIVESVAVADITT